MAKTPKLFDIRSGEFPPSLLMFGFFFSIIAVFQILKPLKKGLFVAHFGAEQELIAKGINIDVAFGAMIGFTYLYNWLGGRRLVRFLCGFFFLTLLLFFVILSDTPPGAVNYAFYIYGDLWSTVWVATFWAFLNEISTSEQSARLYGFIGAGGLLGGIVGSSLVSATVQSYSSRPLILLCLVFTGLILLLTWQVDRLARRPDAPMAYRGTPFRLEKIRFLSALDGARMAMKSKYLFSIVLILALYEFCSQIMDFQFSAVLARAVAGGRNTQAYLGNLYLITNVLALGTQLILTTFLVQRSGPGAGLIVLPAAISLSSSGFWLEPSLLMGSLLIVSDNGLNYSINQTSREMLFVPTSSEAQYKARAFTNMFVQRLAKGAATVLAAAFILVGVRWLSPVTLAITVTWIVIAVAAGRRFHQMTQAEPPKNQKQALDLPLAQIE
ncbi:MAG: Npt1/Npt2 family nucleotide transporter [Acidobacteriota bacterium]